MRVYYVYTCFWHPLYTYTVSNDNKTNSLRQVVKLFAEAIKYSSNLDTTSLFHYRQREAGRQG